MRFVSFAYLFSLVMTSSQVNKSEKRSLLAVAPSWGEVTQVAATEHDVSCRFLRDAFYHWGISFHSLFAESFHSEWFEFIKCFSCTYWDLFDGCSPYSANVVNYRWSSNIFWMIFVSLVEKDAGFQFSSLFRFLEFWCQVDAALITCWKMVALSSLKELIWNLSYFSFKCFVEFTSKALLRLEFSLWEISDYRCSFKLMWGCLPFLFVLCQFCISRNFSIFSKSLSLGHNELRSSPSAAP